MDVIIYHNADPDGIFSGAVALKADPTAQTIGYNYEPDFSAIIEACAGKRVVMVDVSPSKWSDMHRLCAVAESVVWIDHHATAFRQMQEMGTPVEHSNFTPVFEHEKWGAAKKVFEYFNPGKPLPSAIEYVAAYDVFRAYGSYDWTAYYFPFRFSAGLLATPQAVLEDFAFDDERDAVILKEYLVRGRAIAQYLDADNALFVNNPGLCAETSFRCDGKAYKVLAVNKGLFGDMFKSRDLSDFDFVVGFFCQATQWKISLRGAGKEIDLGAIAKTFGGGGHKDAAGFSVQSFDELRRILFLS